VENITHILCEYHIFPTTFSDMKGITGELGEMKIFEPDAKLVRQINY
jgi:hypothetical protein